MNDKDMLINIYNAMLQIEVKGRSVLILSDCLNALQTVIDSVGEPQEVEE